MQSLEGTTKYFPQTMLKYGYLGKDGQFAIAPQFDFAQAFVEGVALVVRKGEEGSSVLGIDKVGNTLFTVENCESIGFNTAFGGAIYNAVSPQIFNLTYDDKGTLVHEVIDSSGTMYWPRVSRSKRKERFDAWKRRVAKQSASNSINWKTVDTFFDKSEELGILDIRTLRIVATYIVRYAPVPFSCDVTHMQVTTKEGERVIVLFNESGELVARLNGNVLEVAPFNENLAAFIESKIYIAEDGTLKFSELGFIDTAGNTVIKSQFEPPLSIATCLFNDGLAVVRKNNLYGAIDREGKFAIEPKFVALSSFENGLSVAAALVDYDGNSVDPREQQYGIQNLQLYKEKIAQLLTEKLSSQNFSALIRFSVDMHPSTLERKILTQPSDMSSDEVPEELLLKLREAVETVELPDWGQLIFWGDPFQFVFDNGEVVVGFSGQDPQIDLIKKYLELKHEGLNLPEQDLRRIEIDAAMSETLALIIGAEGRKKLRSIVLPTMKAFNGK